MCQAAKEAISLEGLLEGFGIDPKTSMVIYGDNQGALALTQNPIFHPRSKHIDIQYHFTRELVQPGRIILKYIHKKAMVAQSQLAPHYYCAL